MLDLLIALILVLANSIYIAATHHPGDPRDRYGFWAVLVREVLGRLSLLRHSDSPGTLHFPFWAQPLPVYTVPGEVQRRPVPPLPGGLVGVAVGVLLALGGLALFAFTLASCAALPQLIDHRLRDLHAVAEQASAAHAHTCAPWPQRPAICAEYLDCLHHADDASLACARVQQQLADAGTADAGTCDVQYQAAMTACAVAGFRPAAPGGPDAR